MFDLENASEAAFKLRTYNHGSGIAPGLTFTQGLYYNTTENASIKFYRGGSTTGGFLTFTTNDGTEKVRIDNAGNVGIGITSPTTKLEIGISNSSHTNEGILFTSPSGYGQAAIYHDYVNSGDILTNLKLVNTYSDSRIDLVQDSYNAGGSPGSIRFYTQPSANAGVGIERVRITSAGNMGIGTKSPAAQLHISGSGDIRITNNANSTGYDIGLLGGNTDANAYIYQRANAALTLGTNNTDRIRITSDGKVGIGTTSPGANLQIGFQNSSTSEMLRLGVLYTGSPTQRGTITWHDSVDVTGQIDTRYDGSKVNMYFGSLYNSGYNSTVRLTILGDGNVGIGTTTPTEGKLVIANSGPSVIYNKETSQGVNSFWNSSDGSQVQFGAASAHPLLLFTNNSEKVRITSDGNVGIGINSPTAKLDVASSTTGTTMVVGRYSGYPNIKANTDAGGYLILDSNGNAAGINHYVSDNVWLATGGGNVGINTTSPAVKLDVAGTTGVTTQIRTNGADWVTGLKIQTNNADGGYFYTTFVSGSQYASLQAGDNSTYRNISLNHQGGNVGIGITTPATKLHIQGSHTTALFRLYSTGGDGTGGTGPASVCMWASEPGLTYNGSGIGANINNSPYYGRLDSSNGQSYIRFSPADIEFYTGAGNANFRATILSTGRFGIGTTSPQKPFEVISDSNDFVSVGVNQISVGAWTGIHFGYREANNSYRKSAIVFERTDLTSNDAQGKIHILNGPQGSSGNATLSDARLTIGESGNVGINKTSPTYKLDIVGASLGTSVGTQELLERFNVTTSNNDYLELTNTRVANGSTWETAGFRIQQKVDSTWMGYIQFNGNNNGGISFGAGLNSGGPLNPPEALRIINGGNVGIGTTSPTEKLQVDGTIVTDYTIADTQGYRLIKPKNGTYITQTSTVTGAIKITYPVGYTNTMHTIKVKVYEYVTNESFTITFGGYNYSDTPSWYNCFAYIEGNPAIDRNFNVRFGYDGTYMVVYIGELSSTWSYPQVFIEEVALGYSGVSSTWRNNNWTIGFEASAFSNITATVSNTAAHTFVRDGANAYYSLGSIGIGASSPAYKLDVLGTIRATGDVIAYSDARVKDNVEPIENALEKVISLRGVSYNRKDTDDKSRKIGVIAQEVLPIIPEVVSKDQNGNYSVAYGNMVGLLIEAVKEQQKQIDELKYLLENKKKKK